jgi:hypothetical protein
MEFPHIFNNTAKYGKNLLNKSYSTDTFTENLTSASKVAVTYFKKMAAPPSWNSLLCIKVYLSTVSS